MALLSSCLALVKPVGMSEDDTHAWLRIAARELAHMPGDLMADGCAHARKTCTHHAQIVPAIVKHTEDRLAQRRKLAAPEPKREALPKPERWQPTAEELEAIKREAAASLSARR